MSDNFLVMIERKNAHAGSLFVKNRQAFAKGNTVELARELTDLRIQLQNTTSELKSVSKEFENHKKTSSEAKTFDFFLFGLLVGTLILLGISYLYF